jgi:hypothetical protein
MMLMIRYDAYDKIPEAPAVIALREIIDSKRSPP